MIIDCGSLLLNPLSPPDRRQRDAAGARPPEGEKPGRAGDAVLCHHCGRTASNGIRCQGYCVADADP